MLTGIGLGLAPTKEQCLDILRGLYGRKNTTKHLRVRNVFVSK